MLFLFLLEIKKIVSFRNIVIVIGIGWLLGGLMGVAVVGGVIYFLSDNK